MSGRVFIDTSALLALANPRDQYHERAVRTSRRHLEDGGRYVGSTLVLAELHGLLLYRRGPRVARTVLAALLADPAHEWNAVTAETLDSARSGWLEGFGDQRFSVTDAVSFEIMRTRRIAVAFAYDDHFGTAGFERLA